MVPKMQFEFCTDGFFTRKHWTHVENLEWTKGFVDVPCNLISATSKKEREGNRSLEEEDSCLEGINQGKRGNKKASFFAGGQSQGIKRAPGTRPISLT